MEFLTLRWTPFCLSSSECGAVFYFFGARAAGTGPRTIVPVMGLPDFRIGSVISRGGRFSRDFRVVRGRPGEAAARPQGGTPAKSRRAYRVGGPDPPRPGRSYRVGGPDPPAPGRSYWVGGPDPPAPGRSYRVGGPDPPALLISRGSPPGGELSLL